MVPDGWRYGRLDQFIVLQRGFDLTKDQAQEGDVPVISSSGIGYYHNTFKVKAPGVVTGRKGSVGSVYYVDVDYWPHDTSLWVKDFCGNDPKYVWYFLQSLRLERFDEATSIPTLNRNNVHRRKTVFPPLAEQQKIVEVLSTWDQAIEKTVELIANSRTHKNAISRNLLTGKTRLSGFSGEWSTKRIIEISDRVSRRNDGEPHPILTISSHSGFVRQDEKYSRFMAGKSLENYILLQRGEFAYNKGNSKTYEFGCVFALEQYERALVPHVYVCFALKGEQCANFYRALFETDYLRPQLGRVVNTGVRNNGLLNITPDQFFRCEVPVPSLMEQEAIAAIVTDAGKVLHVLGRRLEALRSERSALMQRLLTGKHVLKGQGEAAA